MSKASDVKIKLLVKNKQFTNSKTGEPFTVEALDGYVLYKDVPVLRASGRRIEDKTYKAKKTGKPFTIARYTLNFRNGEDYSDEELKVDGTLFLRREERTNRTHGNKFYAISGDGMYFGKDDERNVDGFKIGNMLLPLNGIIESNSIIDQWGDEANRLLLEASNKYALKKITEDMLKTGDDKVGYTLETPDELFTDEELQGLAQQFNYFERFNTAFEEANRGQKEEAKETKEAIKPASF